MKVSCGAAAQVCQIRNPDGAVEIALDVLLDPVQLPSRQPERPLRCSSSGSEVSMLQMANGSKRQRLAIRRVQVAVLRVQSLHLAQQRKQQRIGDLDVVQVHYSIHAREAEQRILPAAAERGMAVMVNMPFEKGRLFQLVQGRALPDFAREIGVQSWGQFFLKWLIAHPAITCVLPATANPRHAADNMGALYGPLPDQAMRTKMLRHMESIPGFGAVSRTAPYPGRKYPGVIERARQPG
jgi:hypothetical protein